MTLQSRFETLYRIALSRRARSAGTQECAGFRQKQRDYHSKLEPASGIERSSRPAACLAALTDLAHVMLNANEFVYIN